jgi:hypothetical protein
MEWRKKVMNRRRKVAKKRVYEVRGRRLREYLR